MPIDELLVLLTIVFVAGRVGAELSQRLRQPAVVGEIIAGVLIGPAVLGFVPHDNETLGALAELGVIFLLFQVGLDTEVSELRRVGGTAMGVAAGGMVLPLFLGFGLMQLLDRGLDQSLFVGAAMVATSVGITASVLNSRGQMKSREARIILGAAVVDDLLTLLLLGIITAVTQPEVSFSSVALLGVGALGFVVVVGTWGPSAMRRLIPNLDRLRMNEPALAITIAVALGLAASAGRVGLAPIIGAFLAGIVLGEGRSELELEQKTMPLATFFVPFFFVHVGTQLELDAFGSAEGLFLVSAVTALAVVGKFVGSGLASLHLGKRAATIVGIGMIPRGEVGIVVASLALGLGVVDSQLYGVVVIMSIVTSLIAPPILSAMFAREQRV